MGQTAFCSSDLLRQLFIKGFDSIPNFKCEMPSMPFLVEYNDCEYYIYIKNISSAYFLNEDVTRAQLPYREDFIKITNEEIPFLFFGYYQENDVWVCWDPKVIRDRINSKESISLYSRLTAQEAVKKGQIFKAELKNNIKYILLHTSELPLFFNEIDTIFFGFERRYKGLISDVQKTNVHKEEVNLITGKLLKLTDPVLLDKIKDYIVNDELEAISICINYYYPKFDTMSFVEWGNLVEGYASSLTQHSDHKSNYYSGKLLDDVNLKSFMQDEFPILAINDKSESATEEIIKKIDCNEFNLTQEKKQNSTIKKNCIWVKFPSGEEIENNNGREVFISTVDKIGPEKIYPLHIKHCGFDIVDIKLSENINYRKSQYKTNCGFFLNTCLGRMAIVSFLGRFSEALSLSLEIVLFDKKGRIEAIYNSNNLDYLGGSLKVVFPNGTIIKKSNNTLTFLEVIREIGIEDILSLNLRYDGNEFISKKLQKWPKFKSKQHKLNSTYYAYTNLNTRQKSDVLKSISTKLNLLLTIEIE